MNLYEFNQQGYDQMPDYNHDDLKHAAKLITKWLQDNSRTSYYAFICNELRYYTIFSRANAKNKGYSIKKGADIILNVSTSLGVIKSVELTEARDGIEIWIKSIVDNQTHMYLLFNYDKGVIDLCPRNKKTY